MAAPDDAPPGCASCGCFRIQPDAPEIAQVRSNTPARLDRIVGCNHTIVRGGAGFLSRIHPGGRLSRVVDRPTSGLNSSDDGSLTDLRTDAAIPKVGKLMMDILEGSRALRDWLNRNAFMAEYEEVNADHPGMVKLVLPDLFDFFDRSRLH